MHAHFKNEDAEIKTLSERHSKSLDARVRIKTALEAGDMPGFVNVLKSIFARLSYNIKTTEGYYHGFIQLVLYMAGVSVTSEFETNIGRIDVVAETGR